MLIPIKDIRVGNRLRPKRESVVAELADSIGRLGLQNPITVAKGIAKREGGGADLVAFDLIAGAHRLEACRLLGWDDIEALVTDLHGDNLLLWEIDENLCRADLTELERGEHLLQRKAVYERLHPLSRAATGAELVQKRWANTADNLSVVSFAEDTATKIGVTDRDVRRAIRRAKEIDEKVRDRIRDNPEISDSGVELDALAGMEPALQRKAVALVEAGQAGSIRDARKLIEPKPAKPNFKPQMAADEKWWQQFLALMEKASDANRQRAREYLDEPIADRTTLRAV